MTWTGLLADKSVVGSLGRAPRVGLCRAQSGVCSRPMAGGADWGRRYVLLAFLKAGLDSLTWLNQSSQEQPEREAQYPGS